MTATRPGTDDIDTGEEPRPVWRTSGWMVDVATRRVFRAAPQAQETDALAAEEATGHETQEGAEQ